MSNGTTSSSSSPSQTYASEYSLGLGTSSALRYSATQPLSGFELPSLANSSSSSSSSSSSPRTDFYETRQEMLSSYDIGFSNPPADDHLSRLVFSNNLFESTLEHSFASCSPQIGADDFAWLDGGEYYPGYGNDESFHFPQHNRPDDQGFITPSEYATLATHLPNHTPPGVPGPDFSADSSLANYAMSGVTNNSRPTSAELDHYRALLPRKNKHTLLIHL